MSKSSPASNSTEVDSDGDGIPRSGAWWQTVAGRLGIALAASLVAHALLTEWPVELDPPEKPPVPLAVKLSQMPPPPVAVPATKVAPKRLARARRTIPRPNPVAPTIVAEAPAVEEPAPSVPPVPPPPPAAPTSKEESPPPPAPPPHSLPPSRFELVYTVTYGEQGFIAAQSRYRFRHQDGQYELEHITKAKGVVRLVYYGAYKVISRGTITSEGLQPSEFILERGGPDKREVSRFDWLSRSLTLKDETTHTLEPPTYDLLSFMLQFYFAPPQADVLHFRVASARKLYQVKFERVGEETIETPLGSIPTQHWKSRISDSQFDAELWLSPDFHYIPVKIRLASTDRGVGEETLEGIFADPPEEAEKPVQ